MSRGRSYNLAVKVTGDVKDAQSSLSSLQKSTQKFGKSMQSMGRTMTLGVTAPLIALGAVGFKEFAEQQTLLAQTQAVIKSTGGTANITAKQVQAMTNAMARKTGFDDEAIARGQNLLLTFTAIRNEAGKGNDMFTQSTRVMADMSVALGQDTKSSAIQLGKALQDPVKGITALRRVGVAFTSDQKAQIEALVESGNVMGAQKLIMKELNKEFGGSAEAYGKTLPGAMAKLKMSFEDIAASIVVNLVPWVEKAAAVAEKWMAKLEGLNPQQKKLAAILAVVAAAAGPVLVIVGTLVTAIGALISPVGLVVLAVAAAAVGFGILYKKSDTFRRIVHKVSEVVKIAAVWLFNVYKKVALFYLSIATAIVKSRAFKATLGFLITVFKNLPLVWVIRNFGLVRDKLEGAWKWAKNLASKLSDGLSVAMEKVKQLAGGVSEKFGAVAQKVANALQPKLEWLKKNAATALEPLKTVAQKIRDLFASMYNKLKAVGSKIGSVVSQLGKIPGIGDFGRSTDVISAVVGSGGSGALPQGVASSLSPFAALARRQGLQITSGYRPGAVTADGNPSDHGTGHAIDVSNSTGPTPQMQMTALLATLLPGVKQVIYSPLGIYNAGSGWSALAKGSATERIHYNHVHIAAYKHGGIVDRPHLGMVGEAGREAIVPLGGNARARRDRARVLGEAGLSGGVTVNQYFTGEPDPFVAARRAKATLRSLGS
jgi:hypothetical protein